MFTSISPNPLFARCAVSVARDSAAVISGTSRRSSLATALWGRMVFPPGPVYPPTRPSMLTVGRDTSRSSASGQLTSRSQIDPIVLPRNAGSWPGYVFTGDPLRLPAGHFGLGHGSGAHAPDEYYLIESATPKVQGLDGAVRSYVEYLYEVARVG